MRTLVTVAAGLAVVAAACAPTEPPLDDTAHPTEAAPTPDPDTAIVATTGASPPVREPIATESVGCEEGQFYWVVPGCDPARSVELDTIISGGPPPDGIPPIDDPVYESIEEAATWLEETSPVMVVDVNDDVRAYPLAILTWHEIVNDTIGGVPTVVTYCPLCNSALVFERTVEGPDGEEVLDFGTSGRLHLSNLVMYDRQHRNLWTQFDGEAIVGERFLGTRLHRMPAWLFGFGELAELHPDAVVLSRDTGHTRDYGRNPYTGYDQEGRRPFLFDDELDPRFPPMTRVVGISLEDDATAVLLDLLGEERVVELELAGQRLVALWAPGQASALDTGDIDSGREVGQTAVFVAEIDGEPVTLEPGEADGRFVDADTGSSFDLRGRALDGPLAGERLEPVAHDDTFWFVWIAFLPDSGVVAPASR